MAGCAFSPPLAIKADIERRSASARPTSERPFMASMAPVVMATERLYLRLGGVIAEIDLAFHRRETVCHRAQFERGFRQWHLALELLDIGGAAGQRGDRAQASLRDLACLRRNGSAILHLARQPGARDRNIAAAISVEQGIAEAEERLRCSTLPRDLAQRLEAGDRGQDGRRKSLDQPRRFRKVRFRAVIARIRCRLVFVATALCIDISLLLTPALIEGWSGLPKLAVTSAPWANLVACAISLPALMAYLTVRRHPMAFDRELLRRVRIDPAIARSFLAIGVPAGVQMAMASLSEVAVAFLVNGFGSSATAAYGPSTRWSDICLRRCRVSRLPPRRLRRRRSVRDEAIGAERSRGLRRC